MNEARRGLGRRGVLLALGLLLAPALASGADVTPLEIVRNPTAYAGQSITLSGSIATVRPGPMAAGLPVTIFTVMESGAFVTVFTRFPLPCLTGSPVTVTGLFTPFRQLGQERLMNLIEAFSVACR